MNRISAGTIALTLSLPVIALAATKYKLGDAVKITNWSGSDQDYGYKTAVRGDGGPYQGLFKIEMWEQKDNPCKISVRSRHLNTYGEVTKVWDGCKSSPGSKKTIAFTNLETYISGVQVCVQDRDKIGHLGREHIKGLKVWGKKINRATGELTDAGSKKWERTNCKVWKTARHCSSGKVASKIEIRYDDKTNDAASAIRLQCRDVVPK